MTETRTGSRRSDAQREAAPPADGGLDRRALLAGAGSAVVAGLGGEAPAGAQAAGPATARPRRIDAHTHFSSLKVLDALEKEDGKPFVLGRMYRAKPALTDAAARLAILDRNEIDMHVLVPVPWLEAFPRVAHDRALAPQFARMMNDEIAAVVAAHPTRFKGVALLASADPDAMVAELHRAAKELGFVGAYVPVGPTAKRMDHPDFDALYKAIVELDVMLWLHPSRPPLPDYADETASKYQLWQQIGWPYDTTAAMYRIVFSGVFERHPGIRIITHHHGGIVPYYAGGMIGSWAGSEEEGVEVSDKIARPYIDHFKKFYCDTACKDFVPKVLELALDFFGPERMLFGSDTPFGAGDGQSFTAGALRSIEAMQIAPDMRAAILSGNAQRILKIA
ncbi:MAG TPA: amidohydrolase family protein [Xanthobacteraceae bacterium]|nr:amidohydrolase family protein [Xanthobacteraceae bacterium]